MKFIKIEKNWLLCGNCHSLLNNGRERWAEMYVYSAIILGIVMLIIYLLVYAKLIIVVNYTFSKREHIVQVTVYLYRFRLLKRIIPIEKWTEADLWNVLIDRDRSSHQGKSAIAKLQEASKNATKLLSAVHIQELEWDTMIGTGEASTTGWVTGGVWTSKGYLLGYVAEKTQVECEPKINVIPYFQDRMLQTKINCIVTIRAGQAIHTYIQSK